MRESLRVDVPVILRIDPAEPQLGTGPTIYGHLDGHTSIIATANLDALDPAKLGEACWAIMWAAAVTGDGERNGR